VDAGIAALWGAGIGGILGASGAIGSAWLTGKSAGRATHAQWRREGRRQAYSALITSVTEFREAADSLMTLMEESHTINDASLKLERVTTLLPAIQAGSPVVAVEGPANVAALARELAKVGIKAAAAIEFYIIAAQRFDGPGQFEANRAHAQLQEVDKQLDRFTEKAREALDSEKE
jgi:hypothetical protein